MYHVYQCIAWLFAWIIARGNQWNWFKNTHHTFGGRETGASSCLSKSACRYSCTGASGRAKLRQCSNVSHRSIRNDLPFLLSFVFVFASPQPYPVHVTVQHPIQVPIYKVNHAKFNKIFDRHFGHFTNICRSCHKSSRNQCRTQWKNHIPLKCKSHSQLRLSNTLKCLYHIIIPSMCLSTSTSSSIAIIIKLSSSSSSS